MNKKGLLVFCASMFISLSLQSQLQENRPQEAQKDSSVQSTDESLDADAKRKSIVDLVERAANFMRKNALDEAFNRFTHGSDFIEGELYLFVFDMDGVCLAHGQQAHLLWQNLWELRDSFGTPIIQNIIKMVLVEHSRKEILLIWKVKNILRNRSRKYVRPI